jgi:acetate kinase
VPYRYPYEQTLTIGQRDLLINLYHRPKSRMPVLTINSGSTSVKLALYARTDRGDIARLSALPNPGDGDPIAELTRASQQIHTQPQAVAHRIVHGGDCFAQPVRIDAAVIGTIERLSALAPLHNPQALRWVRAALSVWPGASQVAVFDTAFFKDLPRVAAEYALPPRLGTEQGVRRYGFHGLAHQAMWEKWCTLYPGLNRGGRLITVQLGGGCSIAALNQGRPMDTSMGFSPLEGLVMATRSGDVDAAIVPFLQQKLGVTSESVVAWLNEQSGLLGISGSDANPSALLASADPRAQFALGLYCYRLRKYIGAYLAVLGGCDGIVFGGGVGEHVPEVRARVLQGQEWAGILLDPARNAAASGGTACISPDTATVKVHVVTVDEESILARAAMDLTRA